MPLRKRAGRAISAGMTRDDDVQGPDLLDRLLATIEADGLPLTRAGIAAGNKAFGAALLDRAGRMVLAETNNETENPLWHGAAGQPWRARIEAIRSEYARLSDVYQSGKAGNDIPLS